MDSEKVVTPVKTGVQEVLLPAAGWLIFYKGQIGFFSRSGLFR
jgi:hypothetical protein